MGRLLAAACVALAAVGAAGCFETPKPACQFLCGSGGACPEGYACDPDDDRCHRVEANGDLAACTDQLPVVPDAALDAEPVDAEPPDGAPLCAAGFSPVDDGTVASRQALVISEINPGDYIEIYNNTATALDLSGLAYQLHSPASSLALSTTGLTIPSHAFRTVAWPGAFTDTDAGGQILLYLDATDFAVGTNIMDFVCWGTNPHASRQTEAEGAGKWSDTSVCAAAITAGASITRVPATDGLNVADYDVTTAGSPNNCDP